MIFTLLLAIAFVLFLFAAFNVPSNRINFTGAGLACWVLTDLLGHIPYTSTLP